jgi:aerobic-type carbon monoxide dehydrogenase small subunit (CoxS/CutS family)
MTEVLHLRVNGANHVIPPRWAGGRLLDYLRQELGLVGAKEGCGEGDCGACTVLVDGRPTITCLLLCGAAAGRDIITPEGLPEDFSQRFAELCERHGSLQCGFCTAGFAVMTAWLAGGGVETGRQPTATLLAGNICRCGAYQQLARAIAEMS